MDTSRIIGEVYRETGVAIEPGDPVLVSAVINRLVSEADRTELRQILDDLREAAASMPRQGVLSPEAEKQLVASASRAIARETWRQLAIHARDIRFVTWLAGVLGAGALFGAGYVLGTLW